MIAKAEFDGGNEMQKVEHTLNIVGMFGRKISNVNKQTSIMKSMPSWTE